MLSKFNYKSRILQRFPEAQKYRFATVSVLKKWFSFLRHLPGSSLYFGPPRGIHINSQSYNDANSNKAPITAITFRAEEAYTRTMPITNSKIIIAKFSACVHTKFIEKTGFIIYNARYLAGHGGTVITSDDRIFIPCSPLRNEWFPERHQSLYLLKLPPAIKLEKVILIDTNCADNNYSHWLLDHISRFLWLNKMNLDLSSYTLISNSNNNSYQKYSYEMLNRNGLNFKNILHNVPHLSCTELVVPPYSTIALNGDQISYGKEELDFLRQLFIPAHSASDLGVRIYLSRRKSIRTFPQEAELINRLSFYGFKEVFLEDYTISEQAAILHKADLVVGFHGAGFTNLCFCRPGTTVVEIFSPNFIVTNFWGIASQLELCYYAYAEDSYETTISAYRLAREAAASIDIENFIVFLLDTKVI